jgi:hypothetical protein
MKIAIEVAIGPTHACPECGRETPALCGIGPRIATRCDSCGARDTSVYRLVMPINILTTEAMAGLVKFRASSKRFANVVAEFLVRR